RVLLLEAALRSLESGEVDGCGPPSHAEDTDRSRARLPGEDVARDREGAEEGAEGALSASVRARGGAGGAVAHASWWCDGAARSVRADHRQLSGGRFRSRRPRQRITRC